MAAMAAMAAVVSGARLGAETWPQNFAPTFFHGLGVSEYHGIIYNIFHNTYLNYFIFYMFFLYNIIIIVIIIIIYMGVSENVG